ncbi:MAG TPA: N-acetylneuraminate synthase family protein, partial [Polyangia bacterium]|nr:N-acetylneuraminate synthase family protein [Polyangia bacterium]
MTPHATPEQIDSVLEHVKTEGFQPHRSDGKEQTVIGVVGIVDRDVDPRQFEVLDGVAKVVRLSSPFKLASRQFKEEDTIVDVGKGVKVGGREVVLMAGPCTIESKAQVEAIAPIVAAAGARIMRGGAFKPRTSPYSFQGMGEDGLKFLRDAADRYNLLIVSEVMDRSQIEMMLRYVDILQVGARNMQNFDLLKDLGKVQRPVLLKRGIAATLQELLLAAEYIMSGGNKQVILCERGIRT